MGAWASQAAVARGAALLAKAGEGPTAVTTLSERSALVEAKAAAISALGVGCLKAQLRRLEPKARALAASLGRLAAGSFVKKEATRGRSA